MIIFLIILFLKLILIVIIFYRIKSHILFDLNETLIHAKHLHITFDQVGGFIRGYDGSTYLILFYPEKYDSIFDRIRCTIVLKSRIRCAYSYNYAELGWWFAYCKNLDYA